MQRVYTVINALLCSLLGLMYLSSSGDFWLQLPTFLWQTKQIVITENNLEQSPRKNGPMGSVRFHVIEAPAASYSDFLSERFDFGDVEQKTNDFINCFAPGTTHEAFLAPDRSRMSLGHFHRDYAVSFAIAGIIHSIAAICFWTFLFRSKKKTAPPSADA